MKKSKENKVNQTIKSNFKKKYNRKWIKSTIIYVNKQKQFINNSMD